MEIGKSVLITENCVKKCYPWFFPTEFLINRGESERTNFDKYSSNQSQFPYLHFFS